VTVIDKLMTKSGLIDAAELAELLGMNKDKLYKKTRAGEVPHYRLLGRVKYDPNVIVAWMRQRGWDLADHPKK
jgi:excisionase family DNA binding protein